MDDLERFTRFWNFSGDRELAGAPAGHRRWGPRWGVPEEAGIGRRRPWPVAGSHGSGHLGRSDPVIPGPCVAHVGPRARGSGL